MTKRPQLNVSIWVGCAGGDAQRREGKKRLDHSGEKDKGMEAPGDEAKSHSTALVARLDLGGLGEEAFWSSVFRTLWWDKTPKD